MSLRKEAVSLFEGFMLRCKLVYNINFYAVRKYIFSVVWA